MRGQGIDLSYFSHETRAKQYIFPCRFYRWWASRSDAALPDTLFATVSQDPAYYSYVTLFYDKLGNVEQAFLAAAKKMLGEFTEESDGLMRIVDGKLLP